MILARIEPIRNPVDCDTNIQADSGIDIPEIWRKSIRVGPTEFKHKPCKIKDK